MQNSAGATPLHDAALAGQKAVAELLIEKGAPVNARDRESGATPLHHAASWGRVEVVQLLLDHGADPTIRNKNGATPLQLAIENNQPEAAALLKPTALHTH
jgi:ankyrin repeat protein